MNSIAVTRDSLNFNIGGGLEMLATIFHSKESNSYLFFIPIAYHTFVLFRDYSHPYGECR